MSAQIKDFEAKIKALRKRQAALVLALSEERMKDHPSFKRVGALAEQQRFLRKEVAHYVAALHRYLEESLF